MAKNKLTSELVEAESLALVQKAYGETSDPEILSKNIEKYSKTEAILRELLRVPDGKPKSCPKINLKEAVHTADFKILFPRVVQMQLRMHQEPIFIGQGLLARTINVDGAKIMSFPSFGALTAYEVGESQELRTVDPSFNENITEIRTRKFGLKLTMSSDAIDESQWDIVAMYVNAANNALRRKKEQQIFEEYERRSVTMFDNSSIDQDKHTRGKASNGVNQNGTFAHEDLLDMMAALASNGYIPTDVILHPLAWSIWAKDPVLRYQLLHQGQVGQSNLGMFSGTDVQQNASQWVPFQLNVVTSPFQTASLGANPNTGVATGGTFNYTSITVVDRNASIVILQQTAPQMKEYENPERDLQNMAFWEKYGVACLNGGRSSVVAKNVKLAENFAPLFSVRTITAA